MNRTQKLSHQKEKARVSFSFSSVVRNMCSSTQTIPIISFCHLIQTDFMQKKNALMASSAQLGV